MTTMKAGFIGMMPFGLKGDDYYNTLEKYAKIGYKGFEHGSGLLEGDVNANLARVKSFGMEPICAGLRYRPGDPAADVSVTIEQAHKLGVTRTAVYGSLAAEHRFGRAERPSYDDLMREAEALETMATQLKAEGIQLMFHNHDGEFKFEYNGKRPFDLLVANTENLCFELDTAWAAYGGVDPVHLIYQLGNRIAALHIKDYAEGVVEKYNTTMPRFTTPGTGKLDLAGVLRAGAETNQEWAILEMDFQFNLTQVETLLAAYLNMKETGYVL